MCSRFCWLDVRCPNPQSQCAEWFALIVLLVSCCLAFTSITKRSEEYFLCCAIAKNGFEPFRTELVKGDGDCTCAFCHGKVNQCQNGKRDVKDGEEWIRPSLEKTITKK